MPEKPTGSEVPRSETTSSQKSYEGLMSLGSDFEGEESFTNAIETNREPGSYKKDSSKTVTNTVGTSAEASTSDSGSAHLDGVDVAYGVGAQAHAGAEAGTSHYSDIRHDSANLGAEAYARAEAEASAHAAGGFRTTQDVATGIETYNSAVGGVQLNAKATEEAVAGVELTADPTGGELNAKIGASESREIGASGQYTIKSGINLDGQDYSFGTSGEGNVTGYAKAYAEAEANSEFDLQEGIDVNLGAKIGARVGVKGKGTLGIDTPIGNVLVTGSGGASIGPQLGIGGGVELSYQDETITVGAEGAIAAALGLEGDASVKIEVAELLDTASLVKKRVNEILNYA